MQENHDFGGISPGVLSIDEGFICLSKPAGMTRTEISALLGRNVNADRIDAALDSLSRAGKAQPTTETTDGRTAERWLNSFNSFHFVEELASYSIPKLAQA